MIDIHTHILPKADDGARDWETCLKMLAQSAKCGVKEVIATPHYSPWMKGPTPADTVRLCEEVQQRLQTEMGIDMKVHPGNEIYYSVDVIDDMKRGKVLPLANSQYVLLEFSEQSSMQTIKRAVREFQVEGYIPILAHVERYQYVQKSDGLEELRESGALFQVNAESLTGGFFDSQSRWVRKSLKKGLIDFVASDMHNVNTRPPIQDKALM